MSLPKFLHDFLGYHTKFSEKSRRLLLFLGSVQGSSLQISGNPGKTVGFFLEFGDAVNSIGFQAPAKTNLPQTLGRHCPEPCPESDTCRLLDVSEKKSARTVEIFPLCKTDGTAAFKHTDLGWLGGTIQ